MNTDTATNHFPLVSIVMCTYNGEKYLRQQLLSICNQTYSNLEIIISDDNSTDATFSILEEFASKDIRIKLFRNPENIGFTANFSYACGLSSGSFIAISDQDDIWDLLKIEKMLKCCNENTPLVYCNSVRFKDNVPANIKHDPLYRRYEGTDGRKLAIFNTISGHALLMTKNFMNKLLPFREGIMYDWYAGVSASYNGGVGYVDEILVYQREHSQNVSIGKGFDHKDRKYRHIFNDMVARHLEAFSTIENLPDTHKLFFQELCQLWKGSLHRSFSFPLFAFLMKNRNIIFWYKKKTINIISHIKHSYKLASN